MVTENVLIKFLEKFDENPFLVRMKGKEYQIGERREDYSCFILSAL